MERVITIAAKLSFRRQSDQQPNLKWIYFLSNPPNTFLLYNVPIRHGHVDKADTNEDRNQSQSTQNAMPKQQLKVASNTV
jgi:hypothetical protein